MIVFENEASGSRIDMKQELQGTKRGTGHLNLKRRVMALPTTTLAHMVDVKEEDVVFKEVLESGVEFRSTMKEAHEVL